MGLKFIKKAVSAANVPTQLTATYTPVVSVIFQAGKGNTDRIYVGDSTVSSTTDLGIILSVTDGKAYVATYTFSAFSGANPINLADFYIASSASGAYVEVLAIEQ